MRILFIVHQFMPDFAAGTERVTLNLAKAAQADGLWAEVLTVTQSPVTGWTVADEGRLVTHVEGVPVTAIPTPARPLVDLGFAFNQTLTSAVEAFLASRPAFDLVHVMHAFRLTEAVEAVAKRRLPYVVTATDFYSICHRVNLVRADGELCDGPNGGRACEAFCSLPELAPGAYAERIDRLAGLLRGAVLTCVSPYVAALLRKEHADLAPFVIPNGVDLLRFGRPERRAPASLLTIGFIGTISEAKGALKLARAFAEAAPENARLRLVGPCHEPATQAAISQLAEGQAISLEGPVPATEIPTLLKQFDVLAVPSQVPESFSLALHEGFAAGIPGIVSDLGNVGEVVRASGAGRALPAEDISAWAAAIQDVASNPDQIATWAAAIPLPWRVEEEAFLYNQLYRAAIEVERSPSAAHASSETL